MAEDACIQPRWGDVPIVPDTESGIAAIEREQITKPRPMELDGPQLYQPSTTDFPSTYELPSEKVFTDKLVINTLKLVQHVKKLRQTLQAAQQLQESQKSGEGEGGGIAYPPLPAMPIGLEDILTQTEKQTVPYPTECESKEDKFKPCPELDDQCVPLILKKSIAIICAHVGFESTTESVLNILLDILHEFFLKITHLLRAAVDKEHLSGNQVFPDVLEQVFHEIGLGSVHKLQDFYKERVINYHNHVLQQCQSLITEYEKLTHPEQAISDTKTVKYKEENIVQIHFPVSEETEEMMEHGENVIHLEELHTLQNIEHEPATTLADDEGTKWIPHQNQKGEQGMPTETPALDSDDEIIKVSDSPEDHHDMQELIPPTSLSVSDIISASPLGSNKKMKKK